MLGTGTGTGALPLAVKLARGNVEADDCEDVAGDGDMVDELSDARSLPASKARSKTRMKRNLERSAPVAHLLTRLDLGP